MEVTAKGILYKIADIFNLKRDTIADRLKLQKTIYLLQEFGLNLGYGFGWYKYGPYSSDLVKDAYAVLYAEKDRYKQETANWKFSKESKERFEEFKERLSHILNDPEKLELLASVHFVREWNPQINEDNVTNQFQQYKQCYFDKKRIRPEDIKEAFDISKQLVSS